MVNGYLSTFRHEGNFFLGTWKTPESGGRLSNSGVFQIPLFQNPADMACMGPALAVPAVLVWVDFWGGYLDTIQSVGSDNVS